MPRSTLAPLLEDATDAGARKSSGMEFVGRGAGLHLHGPHRHRGPRPDTGPERAATRRAATLILRAEDELAEAGNVIANGYLRLDHQEWIRVVEKRRAALQDR